MTDPFSPLLSPRLRVHLRDVDSIRLSRLSPDRLMKTAVPNIAEIELVSATDFAKYYDDLYVSMFPILRERERSDLIVDRLAKEFAEQRAKLAPYRIVGLRGHDGKAIGAAQFSVLMLSNGQHAVPYLQYLYVRSENRRQDLADVLHTMVLAVATADARAHDNRTVPFTLFETEPANHGEDVASRANATQRAMIHTKAGAVAIMLRRDSDSTLVSPHVQPGLEPDDPPLSLVWVIRRSPEVKETDFEISSIGSTLIAGYYQSLRDEGFPEANIKLAEEIVEERSRDARFVLMPLRDVVLSPDCSA